ncbi:MAG: capsid cement protein [Pyrinomonadaceae bacterium]
MSQPEINLGRFLANAAFTDTPFRFVKLSSGKLVLCGAGESSIGVIQDEPAANEAANVMSLGISKVLAGGTITQGSKVKSDANGKAVAAAAGEESLGWALEGGSNGEYIDVFVITNSGAGVEKHQQSFPALGTDVEAAYGFFRAPYNLTITAASYAPVANITGAATNNRKVAVVNKGLDGNGTDEVAALTYDDGVNATDFNEDALTLSGTPANLDVDEGEILAWASTAPGTGIADPGGLATITYVRR